MTNEMFSSDILLRSRSWYLNSIFYSGAGADGSAECNIGKQSNIRDFQTINSLSLSLSLTSTVKVESRPLNFFLLFCLEKLWARRLKNEK